MNPPVPSADLPHTVTATAPTSSPLATAMLVLVTFFWGLSSSLAKDWQDRVADCPGGPAVVGLTLIALRMLPALALLAAAQPSLVLRATGRAHRVGMAVGLAFFLGFALQTTGLASTTPARSGFFTSLCSAWVPPAAWLIARQRPGVWTLVGLGLGVAGVGVLALGGEGAGGGWALLPGDWLTLAASVFFTVQVMLLDRLGRTIEPGQMTAGFFGLTGLAALATALALALAGSGLGPWLGWVGSVLAEPAQRWRLAVMTVVSTALAFHWMNVYQPRVTASRAALVYLLEPLFAAVVSVQTGHDRWTLELIAGGGLIVAGNLLVELPVWLRERRGR
jgi:drug/metabolite transporter (DMT)-like permease